MNSSERGEGIVFLFPATMKVTRVTAVSASVKQLGAALTFAPNAESARSPMERRKIDAVFVDNELPGALKLIESIRKGTSNSEAVIFACVADSRVASQAQTRTLACCQWYYDSQRGRHS
jgi:DNA-binding response OmpR family regulator